jgi:hypothetical protein
LDDATAAADMTPAAEPADAGVSARQMSLWARLSDMLPAWLRGAGDPIGSLGLDRVEHYEIPHPERPR